MNPLDIQTRVANDIAARSSDPEAVSVLVLTSDEQTARLVGPMLAARLYPTRRFGQVLHAEWVTGENPGFAVDVEVIHPLSAVHQSAGNGR